MDIKNTFKSTEAVYTKFGIVITFQGRQRLSLMFSFCSWVVDSWVSFNYVQNITTAGPGAYDACSSGSALPEKHMDSTISEVLTQSSPGWRWGHNFLPWAAYCSPKPLRWMWLSPNTKRHDPKALLLQWLCIWHSPASPGVQRILRHNRKSRQHFRRH